MFFTNEEKLKDIIAKEAIREAKQKAEKDPADVEKVKALKSKRLYPPPHPVREPKGENKFKVKKLTDGKMAYEYRFYKGCFLDMFRNLSTLDLSEEAMAKLFGIPASTLHKKVTNDADIDQVYQEAMGELESKLAKMMLVMSMGYEYETEKTTYSYVAGKKGQQGEWVPDKKSINRLRMPGNAQLFIMYMTNKFPKLWKVSRELVAAKAENYDETPSKRDRKKVVSLAREILEAHTDKSEEERIVSG